MTDPHCPLFSSSVPNLAGGCAGVIGDISVQQITPRERAQWVAGQMSTEDDSI